MHLKEIQSMTVTNCKEPGKSGPVKTKRFLFNCMNRYLQFSFNKYEQNCRRGKIILQRNNKKQNCAMAFFNIIFYTLVKIIFDNTNDTNLHIISRSVERQIKLDDIKIVEMSDSKKGSDKN